VAELRFDDFTVDPDRLEVRRHELVLSLEPKAFRVLLYLLQNRERAVTKEELMERVWAGSFVTDNALTRVIAQIRKQLGDNAREPRYIETLATTGYRFVAPVSEDTVRISEPGERRKPSWIGLVAAVAGIAIIAAWSLRPRPDSTPRLAAFRQVTSSTGADLWPTFSPDGSQIAYSSNASGEFQIYLCSLAPGGVERRITNHPSADVQPAWSPDGKYIAYVSRDRGIGVMPASGGVTRFVTPAGDSPSWSWDSKRLVYRVLRLNIDPATETSGLTDNSLAVVDVETGTSRPLTRPGNPPGGHMQATWMRDGQHILFSVTPGHGENTRPWKVDTKTGVLTPLEVAGKTVTHATISPDSRFLYFVGWGDGVWQSRLNGDRAARSEILIPASGAIPRDLALSPDGTRIAVSQQIGSNSLWSIPLDPAGNAASAPRPIIQDRNIRHSDVTFSADGSKLAYVSAKLGSDWAIYVANPDGSSTQQFTPGGENFNRPAWFGAELAIAREIRTGDTRRYWAETLAGARRAIDLKMDLSKIDRLRFSHDGKLAVAQISTPAGMQIVIEDLTTHQVRSVTPSDRNIGFPSISPDSRWIAAQERVQGKQTLVMVPVAGGEIRTLVGDFTQAFNQDWSPDSDRVAFGGLRDGVWNIYWVSRTTGRVQQLTTFENKLAFVRYPAWSPKGDQIVFERNDLVANIYVGELR
jgi:Tol biopolymer transport system component/DNA-binding winged helix-turn-helix (wHTH) protein